MKTRSKEKNVYTQNGVITITGNVTPAKVKKAVGECGYYYFLRGKKIECHTQFGKY